jgi:hypothetical protein
MQTVSSRLDDLRSLLQPSIEMLEAERLKAQQKTVSAALWGAIAFVSIAIIGVIAIGITGIPFSWFYFALPGVVIAAIVGWMYSSYIRVYRDGFKTLVMPHIVRTMGEAAAGELNYEPRNGISEAEFRTCGLFRSPDRYRCEDFVVGHVGETQLRFSEVHAEYRETHRDSKGHTRTTYHTIFKGLFLIADFNKNFTSITTVQPDMAERMLGRFGQSLQALGSKLSFNERELVKLEDPEFERAFVVHSGDQIEARYLLSTSLMRRLLDFRVKCGTNFHLAFLANHIYLAVPLAENWFEPPGLGQPLTFKSLSKYTTQLQFALGIIEDLDLNTRIWSKS